MSNLEENMMNWISTAFVQAHGRPRHEKDLIGSVARMNGFFEQKDRGIDLSVYASADEVVGMLKRGRGGIVTIELSHRDFGYLSDLADFKHHDGTRYELLMIGVRSGICCECRGEVETAGQLTCYSCQADIMNDVPIEPKPLAGEFIMTMMAWHTRHGDKAAIERLLAMM